MKITKQSFTAELRKYGNYDCTHVHTHMNPQGFKYLSGFVVNPRNDAIVYISTESLQNVHVGRKCLVRYAISLRDYTGGTNHFHEPANLVPAIHQMLRDEIWYRKETM